MGTIKTYTCNNCSYSVEISGGKDRGFSAITQTYVCILCKELSDVVVGDINSVNEPSSNQHLCPSCNSGEHFKVWDSKKKCCPQCDGGKMKVDANGIVTLWD